MPATTVTLYIRPRRMPDGRRPYLQPAIGKNNRIRSGWALYKGTEIEVPRADYYIRYRHGGKPVFRRIGEDLSVALVERLKQEKTLEAIAAGVVIPVALNANAKGDLVANRIKDFLRACLRSLDLICRSHQGGYMQLLHQNVNSVE